MGSMSILCCLLFLILVNKTLFQMRQSLLSTIKVFYLVTGTNPSLSSQPMPQYILDKCVDQRDNHVAYTAEVDLELKWFNAEDTLRSHADIEMVRSSDDSLFGAKIYIELDTVAYGYDGKKLIHVNKQNSTLEIADPVSHPGLWIASTWVNNFVEYGFIGSNQWYRTVLSNPDIKTTAIDTMIGQWPCVGFYFRMPDEGEFINQYAFVAIDTIEFLVRKRLTSVWFQDNQQYQSWTYLHPRFNQETAISRLEGNHLSQYMLIGDSNPINTDSSRHSQYQYSLLEGKVLGRDQNLALKDVTADVIILDFWYSSCYPCIKSIPEVNKLHDRYKDKNVKVFGVNILDHEETSKARIEKYLHNNPMHYETIMADGDKFSAWVSEGYPTLLILDKDFHLIQQHTGFSEDMADSLSKVIDVYLSK